MLTACLVLLDVEWDISSSIIANEMNRFQPDVVIMSGLGGSDLAEIESAAVNRVQKSSGFQSDGNPDLDDIPTGARIDSNASEGTILSMTWDQSKLAESIRPLLQAMNYDLSTPTGPAAHNQYVCNDVSYVALMAAGSQRISMAGGLITLAPAMKRVPKVGFFHYPLTATLDPIEANGWAQILLTLALQSLDATTDSNVGAK